MSKKDLLAHLIGMSRGRAGFRVDFFQWFNDVFLFIEVLLLSSGCLSVCRSFRFTSSKQKSSVQHSLCWEQLRPVVHGQRAKGWEMLTDCANRCVYVCVLDVHLEIQPCKEEGKKKCVLEQQMRNIQCRNCLCSIPCVRVLSRLSHVRLCAALWIVTRQASLSMGFSRQEYWNGFQRWNPHLLHLLHLQIGSLTTSATWEACAPLTGDKNANQSTGALQDLKGRQLTEDLFPE